MFLQKSFVAGGTIGCSGSGSCRAEDSPAYARHQGAPPRTIDGPPDPQGIGLIADPHLSRARFQGRAFVGAALPIRATYYAQHPRQPAPKSVTPVAHVSRLILTSIPKPRDQRGCRRNAAHRPSQDSFW
jgi:hypothetical protein